MLQPLGWARSLVNQVLNTKTNTICMAWVIPTSGSGEATLYLVGPAHSTKRTVRLGTDIQVQGEEIRTSGRYVAILATSGGTQSAAFFVVPATPEQVSFLARPSRVPAAAKGAAVAGGVRGLPANRRA